METNTRLHDPAARRTALWAALVALMSVLLMAIDVSAQDAPPVAPAPSATLTDSQLQTLLAPIALYPDPLIAQILPASTYPAQVALAARWLTANPTPSQALIEAQPVEPSIKALLHYPTVLAMMNTQLDWTQSLGVAFLNQQADVMNAIQELRAQAQSVGSLQTTAQQEVVMDGNDIEILPVDPNTMYVPAYDSTAAYYGDDSGDYMTFGVGYPEGIWLDYGVDWNNRWIADGFGWNHGWANQRGGNHPSTAQWQRNRAQPLPVRAPPAHGEAVRPGYENPRAPAAGAFNGYQNRAAVQQSVNRAEQSRPAPAPQARPAPRAAPAPAPARAPTQAFHPQGNGAAAAAQSARGSASRGGGGGAPSGGGARGRGGRK